MGDRVGVVISVSMSSSACLLPTGKGFPNVEDLENWHGKPLGPQAAAAIEACTKRIVNPGPHGIKPLAVVDDAPHFTIPVIKLDTPPNYKLGDKVRGGCGGAEIDWYGLVSMRKQNHQAVWSHHNCQYGKFTAESFITILLFTV